MTDARFTDGVERPLALMVQDTEDLSVLSALLQDGVLTVADMRYVGKWREFAFLVNRFRWEDREAAARAGRSYERVRTLVLVRDVMAVRSQGLHQREEDTVLSLLSVGFEAGEDGAGGVVLTFAGDGAVWLEVEAINITARDVTRPYVAPSGSAPRHAD